MANKLTKAQLDYYSEGVDSLAFTSADASKVDAERLEKIDNWANADVSGRKEKRGRPDFKNDEEYKFYRLALFSWAYKDSIGLEG